MQQTLIKGFSKLSRSEKLEVVSKLYNDPVSAVNEFNSFNHSDGVVQQILEQISENTVSNYPLPYNVAPNFLINGKMYMLPMVIEESSVVAAAASAARFWAERGGFHATVAETTKTGQLHFLYKGDAENLKKAMPDIKVFLLEFVKPLTRNMESREGGILDMELKDWTHEIPDYFQLHVSFNTVNAMGANFINTCLEEFSEGLVRWFKSYVGFKHDDYEPLMAILSNYNDRCTVRVSVQCALESLEKAASGLTGKEFAHRFSLAVKIADTDVYRATTHNKGIMNGVDALILATGNDFRAIEAGAHAWAARTGRYRSLSRAQVTDAEFSFSLEMPMALGTVGGLTNIHPLAARSLEMLGNPTAEELMMIAAAAGLANNFAAVRSLTTTGIQAGHMRMHLANILIQLNATPAEAEQAHKHFSDKKVSHQAVATFLNSIRT